MTFLRDLILIALGILIGLSGGHVRVRGEVLAIVRQVG